MEIIKHLHILGLITHDAVVSSLCFQLILVQPQSLSKKHYYLDSAQATTGLLKIIILILKQFLPILCHYSSSSASKGLQIDILASVIPPKCDSSWMYTGFWEKKKSDSVKVHQNVRVHQNSINAIEEYHINVILSPLNLYLSMQYILKFDLDINITTKIPKFWSQV